MRSLHYLLYAIAPSTKTKIYTNVSYEVLGNWQERETQTTTRPKRRLK